VPGPPPRIPIRDCRAPNACSCWWSEKGRPAGVGQFGDLLVSRGGAEVSAFISRGNDFPGNFSHVAIIHINEETNEPYLVEAHIEKGVAIATLDEYLNDKKLRFMVMRPRIDLEQMIANPMLPHEASLYIFNESQTRHIPYDFKMDYYDSSAMFCSEVGSYAYKQFGINLWESESTISSNGIIEWLNNFGVENFVTQMPSDLEYDPMLSVVAEWRDKEILFQDHVDNAVMDALISRANEGEKLDYNLWMLPVARVIKGYSLFLNSIGKEGVIPEGMGAVTALKNTDFVDRFKKCKSITELKFFGFDYFDFRGVKHLIARSGWSKQGGYEVYVENTLSGQDLYDHLFEIGKDFNVKPGCPNLIERIESGLLSYGNDFDNNDNPFECGFEKYVNLDSDIIFLGKENLKKIKSNGIKRKLMGVQIETNNISLTGSIDIMSVDGNLIGELRSACYSPHFKKVIGIAMIKEPFCKGSETGTLKIEGKTLALKVCDLPFI